MIKFRINYDEYTVNTPEEMLEKFKLHSSNLLKILILEQNLDSNFLNCLLTLVQEHGLSNKIKELSLYKNQLDDEGAMSLANFISCSSSILSLDLMRNNIGDTGAIALADAIASCHQFTYLSLNHNKISDKGIKSIAQCLATHHSLQKLDLEGNPFSAEGFKAIATALGQNTSLLTLNFFNNGYSEEGLVVLADALKKHPSIKQLKLSAMNREGDRPQHGWSELAEAIKRHPSLKVLHIFGYFSDCLGRLFMQPDILLEELRLNCANLKDTDAAVIAHYLSTNKTLRELDISSNDLSDDGLQQIQDGLSENTTLRKIKCILNTYSSPEAIKNLTKTAKSRPALKNFEPGTKQEPSPAASSSQSLPASPPAEQLPKGKGRHSNSNSTKAQKMKELLSRIEKLEETNKELTAAVRELQQNGKKQSPLQKTPEQIIIQRLTRANERLARSNRQLAQKLTVQQTLRGSGGFFSQKRTLQPTPISIVDDSGCTTTISSSKN